MSNKSASLLNPSDSYPPQPGDRASDSELLAVARDGKVPGFALFVERYQRRVLNYLYRHTGDRHMAEDLTQDVFIKAFRAAADYQDTGRPSAASWLFCIAHNHWVDTLRRAEPRHETLQHRNQEPADLSDPAHASLQAETQHHVERAILALPDDQRQVLTMRIFGDLGFAEISEAISEPIPTVKSRMRYALQKLRQTLHRSPEVEP